MITKTKIAAIKQLHQKKFRDESDLFLIEGTKSVLDLVNSNLAIKELLATDQWLLLHKSKLPEKIAILAVSEKEMERISCLKTPQEVLAVAVKPNYNLADICDTEPILVLDDIRDPGNMGTIVRTADWFGFRQIVCSSNSVELTNPKTIQATMGSFSRVKVFYTDLVSFLNREKKRRKIYGTFMDGSNLAQIAYTKNDILIVGNESNGISGDIAALVTERIHIPSFALTESKAESLNASIAAAIVMYQYHS